MVVHNFKIISFEHVSLLKACAAAPPSQSNQDMWLFDFKPLKLAVDVVLWNDELLRKLSMYIDFAHLMNRARFETENAGLERTIREYLI